MDTRCPFTKSHTQCCTLEASGFLITLVYVAYWNTNGFQRSCDDENKAGTALHPMRGLKRSHILNSDLEWPQKVYPYSRWMWKQPSSLNSTLTWLCIVKVKNSSEVRATTDISWVMGDFNKWLRYRVINNRECHSSIID